MLKIVRNDLIRMECEAIVNTANSEPVYSSGVDTAVYEAAGAEQLLAERQKIGHVDEGEVFVTEAYKLPFKKIIHAVSPLYIDGASGEEEKLRSCYKKSLEKAAEIGIKSIAFPIIATGSFGYPIEQGMSIAIEEINEFLAEQDMLVYLVVFNDKATDEGRKYKPDLESFIENNYVDERLQEEYFGKASISADMLPPIPPAMPAPMPSAMPASMPVPMASSFRGVPREAICDESICDESICDESICEESICEEAICDEPDAVYSAGTAVYSAKVAFNPNNDDSFYELEEKLNNRLKHVKDSFSDYLMYLIESRGMTPLEVYNNSVISKKLFSKIKTNPDYHPSKEIALRLCIGARLNIDDSRDLLSRAGYTFSPCELYDLIFEFFIENEIYDIVEIAIQLEDHGLDSFIDI